MPPDVRVYAGICNRHFAALAPDVIERFQNLGADYRARMIGQVMVVHERTPPTILSQHDVTLCGDLSPSDAERALDRYINSDGNFLDALKGEFSVVLIDSNRLRIVAATDRLGLTPLYYARVGDDFVWATVPSLVAQHSRYRFEPDQIGIAQFLFGFDRSDGRSFYDGISRLSAATVHIVTPERTISRMYWKPGRQHIDAADGPTVVRESLLRSITARHRSGATGLLLSGGLDSSSIACLAAEAGLDLRTYSLVFNDSTADERHLIDLVVKKYGLPHRRIELPSQMPDEINVAAAAGAPDLRYVPNVQMHAPQFQQMREDGIEVCLDGIGGDQLFGSTGPMWRRVLGAAAPKLFRFIRRRTDVSSLIRAATPMTAWRLTEPARFACFTHNAVVGSTSLLQSVEAMSLLAHQNGIATRSPYLDEDLVELVASLPPHIRSAPVPKHVLRNAVKGIVPEAIRTRTAKAHYANWFDHDLRVRQRHFVIEFLTGGGPAEGLLTEEGRGWALQYLDTGVPAVGRWICSNWLAVQQWWRFASEGAFYVRERTRSPKTGIAQEVAEAGSEVLG